MANGVVTPGALPTITPRSASQATVIITPRWEAATRRLTWGAFAIMLVLAALAPIARTGDAHQYYAMSTALADLRPPALTAAEVDQFKAWLYSQPAESAFAKAEPAVDQPPLIVDGRQEFSHFWLYPLLAAPFVALLDALALHRGYAFLVVNASLLGLAVWMVQRTLSPVVALLLLASPVIWFVNKAQVEIFTLSLLAIAVAEARRGRYLGAAFAAAIASTQNAPILAAVGCFWATGLIRVVLQRQRPTLTGRAVVIVALTVLAGALHPAYYLWRLGVLTPQQLNGGIRLGLPAPESYLAVLIDPDIGLLPWMPLFGLSAAVGLALVWLPGRSPTGPHHCGVGAGEQLDRRLTALCGLVIGAWLLFVFAQTTNVNSGGTVHISRYALWLLPLGLPLVAATADWLQPRLPALLPLAGLVAWVGYGLSFHPAQGERYLTPSPHATFLTTWAPELYRPVPEIFYERRHHVDGGVSGSAATNDCRLILLHADATAIPCPLSPVESATAASLLTADWQAVWIVRPGPLGLGDGRVAGAIPRP